MKLKFHLLLLICLTTIIACKRKPDYHPVNNIGDDAPTMRLKTWLKGAPVDDFEKGKVYVIEFWATWCVPCKVAMPHLSALAKQYKNEVTFLAIDIYEQKTGTKLDKVQAVVNEMGDKMAFGVAAQDSNFMERDWLEASGQFSIPSTFVIDRDGKIAWIGHPKDLEAIIPKIINNTWDINAALAARNLQIKLTKLDEQLAEKANRYAGYWNNNKQRYDFGRPDSALIVIDSMVKKEPQLKFQPSAANFTFYSQLKANRMHDAYQYGREALSAVVTDHESLYSSLIGPIQTIRELHPQIKITPEIYQIAAECQQRLLDIQPYPELVDIPATYKKIAMWHRLSGNKLKAMEAEQKAVKFKDQAL